MKKKKKKQKKNNNKKQTNRIFLSEKFPILFVKFSLYIWKGVFL